MKNEQNKLKLYSVRQNEERLAVMIAQKGFTAAATIHKRKS